MKPKATKEMKLWFGQGENDVDEMLQLGIITEDMIVQCWNECPDSPKFKRPPVSRKRKPPKTGNTTR